ncbi:hypothetical protein BJV74DRAFT_167970 [Russula compacta]|nr:hypothetical protein BJV74DRAFT_167970 [Russula compacta]
MQKPFPELTYLELEFYGDRVEFLPEAFLGGFVPRLRSCHLQDILFPALRKLLLSASHLVTLLLRNNSHSEYISPEAIATCLSTTPNLEFLQLEFPRSRPSTSQRLPPLTHTILPALTDFRLKVLADTWRTSSPESTPPYL